MRVQFQYLPLLCDTREKIFIACSFHSAQLPSAVYNQWKICHEREETRTKVRPSCETVLNSLAREWFTLRL